jgi:hypothetical protein
MGRVVVGRVVRGVSFDGASCPWGELSMGWVGSVGRVVVGRVWMGRVAREPRIGLNLVRYFQSTHST